MLHTGEAYQIYSNQIYDEERLSKLEEHNIGAVGSVPPEDWELFGAVLTGEAGSEGYGADLAGAEVKSAVVPKNGSNPSFEYQYHLNTGEEKLLEDMRVNHFFIVYSRDYADVDVWGAQAEDLRDKFESWMPGLKERYQDGESNRRYRKNISLGKVKKRGGKLVMRIRNGELIEENPTPWGQ